MSRPSLRLRRHGHACVRIDTGASIVVIDPGDFSDEHAELGADAVLHTHGHYDHFSAERIRATLGRGSDVTVWGSPGTVRAADLQGIRPLSPGRTERIAGVEVRVLGGAHADIDADQPAGDNVALLIDGRVYHPGDSFVLPEAPVEVLLAPIQAPWSRLSDVVDFIRAVDPDVVIPIHDALLSQVGLAAFDRQIASRIGSIAYRRLDHEWYEVA